MRSHSPRFTLKDAAAWRRLIRCARQAARNPKRFAGALGEAATACRRAVPPPGLAVRDSVFLKLHLAGLNVWSAAMADPGSAFGPDGPSLAGMTVSKAEELERLADACEAVLDLKTAPPAPSRQMTGD